MRSVRELFEAALERESAEREAFLDGACKGNPSLHRELSSLLAAHEGRGPLDRIGRMVSAAVKDEVWSASDVLELGPGSVVVGRYRIEERLGTGGMGVVFRAHDPRLGRPVALKVLSRELSDDEKARERFLVEARAAAALDHPNLCQIHEIGHTRDGRLFLVMPCYPGVTLAERLTGGALPLAEAVDIAIQTARGLSEAHRAGFIHRDIKPGNLMLTPGGVVKILDFGLALRTETVAAAPAFRRAGTVAYMSPEQARGQKLDVRTDVWSSGVVLYEMLAGRRPFDGPSTRVVLQALLFGVPEPVSAFRPEVPPALAAVVMRTLEPDRHERPADGTALLEALSKAAGPRLLRELSREADRRPGGALLPQGERRQAVVLHARLKGSAKPTLSAVRRTVARHGGMLTRCAHHTLTVLFGVPTAHEDDPLRAVRAAVDLHEEVARASGAVDRAARVRIGLDAGWVEVAQADEAGTPYRVRGSPVDGAGALSKTADPGTTLASSECRRRLGQRVAVQPAPPVRVPGRGEPLRSYVVGSETQEHRPLGLEIEAGLTPLVGRLDELRVLQRALESTLEGDGVFVSVVGEAGVGKSRLLHEFRRQVRATDAVLVQGRCLSYGAAAYGPFLEAMRERLAMGPETGQLDAARVSEAVRALDPNLEEFVPLYLHLFSIPGSEERLPLEGEQLRLAMIEAISAVLTIGSLRRPTVMLLEDWHLADPASTEVLRQLVEMGSAHPLMIVLTCRPGHGVDWGPSARHTPLQLRPLGPEESASIARAVLGAERMAPELTELIYDRTGGNAFFLEEVSRGLREAGAVRVLDGEARPVGSLEGLRLPETVQGVIRARLDRLDRAAREVLACASVIGRQFSGPLLEAVVEEKMDLNRSLEVLRGAGLIQQVRVLPVPMFRFRHVLTEEVAYEGLLVSRRRILHGRVGRGIERLQAGRLDEELDRLVHHFSRAGAFADAVRYGREACRRTASLSQFSEALALGDRVLSWIDRLPADEETEVARVELLFRQERLCETLGLRDRQRTLVDELVSRLERRDPDPRFVEALLRRGDLHTLLRESDAAERSLSEALRVARSLDDLDGQRNVLRSLGLLRWNQRRDAEALAFGGESLAINRARGDVEGMIGDLSNMGIVLRGMGRLGEARGHLERALHLAERDWRDTAFPVKHSFILHNLANVHRQAGRDDLALEVLERAWDLCRDRMLPIKDSYALTALGHMRLREGRVEESLELYREAVEVCRRAGNATGHAQSARILGNVLLELGRAAQAIPYLREAVQVFHRLEDAPTHAVVLQQLARAYATLGRRAEAVATWSELRRLCEIGADVPGQILALEGLARSFRSSDAELSRRFSEEGLELARKSGDRVREVSLLNGLGILEWKRGEPGRALHEYTRSLEISRELGDRMRVGIALNSIAACLRDLGRGGEALLRLQEALQTHRSTGQRLLEGHALAVLGDVHRDLGHPEEAARAYGKSLKIRKELDDHAGAAWMLVRLAELRRQAGNERDARRLAAEAREVGSNVDDRELASVLADMVGDGPRAPVKRPDRE